jgi:hypothetical protein
MASVEGNPFTLLSLIAAPAVLTNASSVLALGTSNRFARAIDRARQLAQELREHENMPQEHVVIRLRQLNRAEKRSLLLVDALASFYLSLGCFAAASLTSLLGAGLSDRHGHISGFFLAVALTIGMIGVGGLVFGAVLLIRETRLAVMNLREEAEFVRVRHPGLATEGDDRRPRKASQ